MGHHQDQRRRGVLFDVDGTLVDTNYLHTLAWSRALDDVGEWAPMHAIHRLIGMDGHGLVNRLLGRDMEAVHPRRAARYRELLGEIRPFPGASDLLRALHDHGVAVVIASSSSPEELDVALDALGARDAVTLAVDGEAVRDAKPAPDVFVAALDRARLDPRWTLAIGDSVWDVIAARAAGVGLVGVESGGSSRSELMEQGALQVQRGAAEILSLLHVGPLAPLLQHPTGTTGC